MYFLAAGGCHISLFAFRTGAILNAVVVLEFRLCNLYFCFILKEKVLYASAIES